MSMGKEFKKLAELLRNDTWIHDAACKDMDTDVFFRSSGIVENRLHDQEAKEVCWLCPVQEDCLDHALRANERFGIWGGLDEQERRKIKRDARAKRKRGAA